MLFRKRRQNKQDISHGVDWLYMSNERKKSSIKENHEYFYEYSKIILDKGWKEIFEGMAAGNFYTNFYFKDSILKYSRGKDRGSVNIEEGPDIIIGFMKKYGVNSSDDREYARKKLEEGIEQKKSNITWASINKNRIKRNILISDYCHYQNYRYDLSDKENNILKSFIHLHIYDNNITEDNIEIKDGYIKNINNITFDTDNRKWNILKKEINNKKERKNNKIKINNNILSPYYKTTSKNKNKSLSSLWASYLRELNKNNETKLKNNNYSKYSTGRSYISTPRNLS